MNTIKKVTEVYVAPEVHVLNIAMEHNILQASGTGQTEDNLDFSGEYW